MQTDPTPYASGTASLFTMAARGENLTARYLRIRRDEILLSIEQKQTEPTLELLGELAEINRALGEAE